MPSPSTQSAADALRGLDLERLEQLPPAQQKRAREILQQIHEVRRANPLAVFSPYPAQQDFLASDARTRLLIGGNQIGKTTTCQVDNIVQAVDEDAVPAHLRPFKRWQPPFFCRIMAPGFSSTIEQVVHVKLRELLPADQLRGNSWARAYDKKLAVLRFKNGSWFQFASYEQDLDKLGGVTLHRVCFDEEPPIEHFRESRIRLVRYGGDIIAGYTPTLGLSWSYDSWYVPWEQNGFKPFVEPGTEGDMVSVHRASMDDNPYLTEADIAFVLADVPDEYKEARKKGLFVALHGLIYQFSKAHHVVPSRPLRQPANVVVGIDPGMRYAVAVVWVAVDAHGRLTVFDELLEDGLDVSQTAERIHRINAYHGVTPFMYVIDPAARNRVHQTGRSDQMEYADNGILTVPGQNDRTAGMNRVKWFLSESPASGPRLQVMDRCSELIREFGRYRWKDPPKSGEETREAPVKKDDHLLDALRYVVMSRPYRPAEEEADTRTPMEKMMHADIERTRGERSRQEFGLL
jgi:phage terminase large subunit-like protein